MRAGIARSVRRASVWARKHIARGPLILLYHRVMDLPADPQMLSVTPQHFAEHLAIIRAHYHPCRLQDVTVRLQDRRLRNRSIAITFDDGYADNLHCARPRLDQYDTPATVFVTTGQTGRDREFWWDELERLLLLPGRLPDRLCLTINGTAHQWTLGDATLYSEADYRRHCLWNVQEREDASPRHRLYRILCQLLRPLESAERQRLLESIAVWANAGVAGRSTHGALTADEIVQLAEGGLVEVGAHTVSHPMLASIPVSAQRHEIRESKAALTEILGYAPSSFSYPYGTLADYSRETVKLVREAAFAHACSNYEGTVSAWTDQLQLPRMLVRDWDGDSFEHHLRMWVGA